jgi:hypothetical protein
LCQDAALDAGDGAKVAYIAGAIHRNLELVGKYLGEFAQHQIQTSVSIVVSAEYLEFRAALMRALAPYPEARRAVAVALHATEAKSAPTPVMADPSRQLPVSVGGTVVEHEASNATV